MDALFSQVVSPTRPLCLGPLSNGQKCAWAICRNKFKPPGPLMVKHAIGKGPWIKTILLLRKLTIPHLLRIKIGEGCVLNIHTLPLQLAKSDAHSLDE